MLLGQAILTILGKARVRLELGFKLHSKCRGSEPRGSKPFNGSSKKIKSGRSKLLRCRLDERNEMLRHRRRWPVRERQLHYIRLKPARHCKDQRRRTAYKNNGKTSRTSMPTCFKIRTSRRISFSTVSSRRLQPRTRT